MGVTAASGEGIMPLSVDEDILHIPQRLAAKLSGAALNSNYQPASNYAGYDAAMKAITGSHANFTIPSGLKYKQAPKQCARYALLVAWSIYKGKAASISEIYVNEDDYATWGSAYGTATTVQSMSTIPAYQADVTENDILLAIDAQLQMGRPALIQVYNASIGDFHWATVIGKDNSKNTVGEKYTVADPATGTKVKLTNMAYYPNGGKIVGYAILSTALS